jgi:aspartate 1-decarboxylase
VEIYNVTNGERFATYTIVGERGTGELTINGAAAHKARAGDLVILVSYADYDEAEVGSHRPVVVRVDGRNRIVGPIGGEAPERPGVRAAG